MRKKASEMVDIELIEAYSHYTKMGYKTKEEQDYTATLRREILERMKPSVTNDTKQALQDIADIKQISINKAVSSVLDNYSYKYLKMIKNARQAADNAIQRYDS